MNPDYITGLTQTDGSFSCGTAIYSTKNSGEKISFQLIFEICADLDSKYVLDDIQLYLKCGKIIIDIKDHTARFIVTSKEELKNIIIPHFNKYPLFCAKLNAFNLFKKIFEGLENNIHKDLDGRKELVAMAFSMNIKSFRTPERKKFITLSLGIPKELSLPLMPNTIKTIDSKLSDEKIAGIIDGDGSFWVSFSKNGSIKTGFSITMDNDTIPLLKKIQERFQGIGSIQKKTETYSSYFVHGLRQIIEVLIPFMDCNPLLSERVNHYKIFKEVSLLLNTEQPLKFETINKIINLAYEANKGGKRRRMSKEEYITLINKLYLK